MLIRLLEILAVIRKQNDYPGISLGKFSAVVQFDMLQRRSLAQINLPPGVVFVLGVKSPLAVFDTVERPDGILLGGHFHALSGRASVSHRILT